MLKTKDEKIPEKSGVGVIIARFQVAELTQGHRTLIQSVIGRHSKTIIILGINGSGAATKNNPLDFETRARMIQRTYNSESITFACVRDSSSDETWSNSVDEAISSRISIGTKAVIYGSRDSFSDYYSGVHPVKLLEHTTEASGTESRKQTSEIAHKDSRDFREGAIAATQNQYPTAYPVVDIAIINKSANQILLGRKIGETLWRFPGGFVDPEKGFKDNALEDTVKREAYEETTLEVGEVTYVGSFFIDDWRYRSEVDCIMTVLFKATYLHGMPKAGDDLVDVKWFPLDESTLEQIGPKSHIKMFDVLIKSTEGKNNE